MASQQARRYLDRLHESVRRRMGRTPRPRSGEEFAEHDRIIGELLRSRAPLVGPERLEELGEGFRANERRLRGASVSEYEDAHTMQNLHMLADTLERAGRATGREMPDRSLFGTLPTGRVNVMTLLVPGTGEHLVVFESEFSGFAYPGAKALAEALPYRRTPGGGAAFELEPSKVRERLRRRPESARRFGELVTAYLETGRPYEAPRYTQEPVRNTWAMTLCESVQLFALGHEYGHILAGHLGSRRPAAGLGGPGLTAEELAWSRQEEFDADARGLTLSVAAMRSRGWDVPTGFLGADFYFTMTHVRERAVSVLRHGRDDVPTVDGTHPSSVLRRPALRYVASRDASPRIVTAIEPAMNAEQAVEMLWENLRPLLLAGHRAGRRPLERWRD